MKMIAGLDLDKLNIGPIISHTSKGDQPKWLIDGFWYKQDNLGYESLAEIVASFLLKNSNIDSFVEYKPSKIIYNEKEHNACFSKHFLKKNEELISIERLHLIFRGKGLSEKLKIINDISDRIKYTVDFIEETTEINKVGELLTKWLEFDAFILNEDRHTNNIAVIRDVPTNTWRFSPLFDNGLAFMSDLKEYPLDEKITYLRDNIKSKPFSPNFEIQVGACENIYGKLLRINSTGIEEYIDSLSELYPENILTRVKNIINVQRIIMNIQ